MRAICVGKSLFLYRRREKLYAEVFGMVAVTRQEVILLRRAMAPC